MDLIKQINQGRIAKFTFGDNVWIAYKSKDIKVGYILAKNGQTIHNTEFADDLRQVMYNVAPDHQWSITLR